MSLTSLSIDSLPLTHGTVTVTISDALAPRDNAGKLDADRMPLERSPHLPRAKPDALMGAIKNAKMILTARRRM